MKDCMYTYHYYRKRAVVKRSRTGSRVVFWILGAAALYGMYCISTLVRT